MDGAAQQAVSDGASTRGIVDPTPDATERP
jgi:hypothetical protein